MNFDPHIVWSLRLFLALLLAAASLHKLRDLPTFGNTLAEYRVLPGSLARGLAPLVPVVEGGLAVALLSPLAGTAALLTGGLFLIYSAAIALNLVRGRREISCGCGGFGSAQPIHGGLLWRNGLLLAASAAACIAVPWSGSLWLLVALSLALLLLYAASDQLLANATAGVR